MKSSILFAVGFAVACGALIPVPCRAQAEIAPDHFEMTDVEPVSQNTVAVNGDRAQTQIRDEGRENSNHSCASSQASGNDKSKSVHLQFDLLGFAIAIDACKYDATQPSKLVQAVERIWKQARVKLNYFSSSREATLHREVLQHKS